MTSKTQFLASAMANMFRLFAVTLTALVALILIGCAQQPYEHVAAPDLVPVTSKGRFDRVLLPSDSDLPRFTRVYVEPAQVHMSDYWLKDRRGEYTTSDLQRIESRYGDLLSQTLTRRLSDDTGLTFVDEPAQAQVIFRPVLRELNLYVPDTGVGVTRQYSRTAGNATLDLTVLDASTGAVLGQFVDHRETPVLVRMERANRGTNFRHFRRLMERWTDNLIDYLLADGTVPSAD